MSFDDYDEEHIEPDTGFSLKDTKAEVNIVFNAENMKAAATDILQKHIENNFMPMVHRKLDEYLKLQGYNSFPELLQKVISEEFLKRYPDVVENKVKEIEVYVKNLKPENMRGGYSWQGESISRAAQNKVMEYIEKELKQEVAVTKEWLETFAKNYFANNLFRAMGLMDKMIPTAVQEKP